MQCSWFMDLINEINHLPKDVTALVNTRLKEFTNLGNATNLEWFSELCFCILTANSKAATALKIQEELNTCFHSASETKIKSCIIKHKHRFHNNKTKYILEARKYKNIRDIITKQEKPREWLVNNIKGLGYKESSHFLRNVGYTNYSILDRHIINLMKEHNLIETEITLNKTVYLQIEKIFIKLANKLNVTPAKLDLLMWFLKTGKVLK
jgi:N-glycosylase/DNA lyase